MFDYLLTSALLLALLFIVGYKAEVHTNGNPFFFDKANTNAMRGFWCIIVILVHIPAAYQNKIQDMVGSFAYIGVTFFFMVSAFGLTVGLKNKPDGVSRFWRKRLPALLVPLYLVRVFAAIVLFLLYGEKTNVISIFEINGWIAMLLLCYVIFWISHLLFKNRKNCEIVQAAAVILASLMCYISKKTGIGNIGGWPTELWGFVWGSLLAWNFTRFASSGNRQWFKKCILTSCVALILGVLYLKFKPVLFWGEYLLKILLGVGITLFILQVNTKISISNKIVGFLGSISYEIYLIHDYIIEILEKQFPHMSSGVFIVLTVLLTVLSAYLVHICAAALTKRIYRIKWFQNK